MRAQRLMAFSLATALLGVGLLSCDSDPASPGGNATVRVLLTDAATDYIGSAWVDIGAVQILPSGDGGPITLSDDGTDGEIDLMELQGATTAFLAEGIVEPGTYHQLRLIVESARVVLAGEGEDQYRFSDGDTWKPLKVPSGAQTGIKLNLKPAGDGEAGEGEEATDDDGGVEIVPGETVLVVDFDVDRSFVIQGNPKTPAGIKGMHFKPTLRVVVMDGAGSISGTVSTTTGVSVEGLTVTAVPETDTHFGEYQTQTASGITNAEGKYTIHFVVPGNYTVFLTPPETYVADPADGIAVGVGPAADVVGVDFTFVAGT